MLQPGEVCVASGGCAIFPANVIHQLVRAPAGEIEGRVGHDVICLELRAAIIEESVCVEFAQVGFDATDGQVHLSHFPSGGVGVLAKDGNLIDVAAVILNEFCRLNEHAARTTAGVINAPIKRL